MITRSGDGAVATSRSERRKARTRQALVDATVRLIADGRGEHASIHEITDAADVGFGSFYNHFASKDELFRAATDEVLEHWGRLIDTACAGIDDPAQVFALSLRISCRLAWTNPTIARFLSAAGLRLLDTAGGLAPRALRDIRAAESAGRFTVPDAEVGLSAVAGGLLGLLRLQERSAVRLDVHSVDALTEACLRLLGIDPTEAHRLATLSVPAPQDPLGR